MIGSVAGLLLRQLAGEIAARALSRPLPGPASGRALMFVIPLVRGGVPEPLRETAGGLLRHQSLPFVPAGAGVHAIQACLPTPGCRLRRRLSPRRY